MHNEDAKAYVIIFTIGLLVITWWMGIFWAGVGTLAVLFGLCCVPIVWSQLTDRGKLIMIVVGVVAAIIAYRKLSA